MVNTILNNIQVIVGISSIIAVILAMFALNENIKSRKSSIKPLLTPSRITEFVSDDNLFACSYYYPLSEDIGHPALVHFGIRNIGKGPATNVRVLAFESEEEQPQVLSVGSNVVRIPEGGSIPFVVRIARPNETDYYFTTYSTTIYYEDIFGNNYYLSIRLWIQESGVAIIEYNDAKKPKWREFLNVIHREMEHKGYFEMRKLEETLKNEKLK